MKFCEIKVETTDAFSDIVSEILVEEGSEGVVVESAQDVKQALEAQFFDYYDNSITENLPLSTVVKGYFATRECIPVIQSRLTEAKENAFIPCGTLDIEINIVDDADWKDVWKKFYKPIEFEKTVIVPEFIKFDTDKIKILINPGAAFGTGQHETTSMCIKALESLDVKGKTVADIGCGSGILGITAALLGAKNVFMTDIDLSAISETNKNAELNAVTEKLDIKCCDLLSDVYFQANPHKFDIIIANIVSDVLIRFASLIRNFCHEDTRVILSGIINSRADEVMKAYSTTGFNEIKRTTENEWTMLLIKACRL